MSNLKIKVFRIFEFTLFRQIFFLNESMSYHHLVFLHFQPKILGLNIFFQFPYISVSLDVTEGMRLSCYNKIDSRFVLLHEWRKFYSSGDYKLFLEVKSIWHGNASFRLPYHVRSEGQLVNVLNSIHFEIPKLLRSN